MSGRGDKKLHVMSCYAPTRAASRSDKNKFLQVLDSFISSMSSRESYIILGDLNARVGSRERVKMISGQAREDLMGWELSMMLGKSFCPFLPGNHL